MLLVLLPGWLLVGAVAVERWAVLKSEVPMPGTLGGDKVSMLTHTYPLKPPEED